MHPNSIEWLDENAITKTLDEDTKKQLARLDIFETIDSTNTYLLTHAKDYAVSGCVCLAEEQTQGRGRQGKNWFSPKGTNIYCSLLWRFSAKKIDLSPLSLAIAVMVAQALRRSGIDALLQFKWPNDIYVNQRKLAGILIESVVTSDQDFLVVIGIGINTHRITQHPLTNLIISLEEITDQSIGRNDLTGNLLNALFRGLSLYEKQGFAAFQSDWERYDMLLNQAVTVQMPNEVIQGAASGITPQGELKVQTSIGLQTFRCGEVSVKMQN